MAGQIGSTPAPRAAIGNVEGRVSVRTSARSAGGRKVGRGFPVASMGRRGRRAGCGAVPGADHVPSLRRCGTSRIVARNGQACRGGAGAEDKSTRKEMDREQRRRKLT